MIVAVKVGKGLAKATGRSGLPSFEGVGYATLVFRFESIASQQKSMDRRSGSVGVSDRDARAESGSTTDNDAHDAAAHIDNNSPGRGAGWPTRTA